MDEVEQNIVIDLRDTDKSRYFVISEFYNCFIIRSRSFNEYPWEANRSDLPFSHKSNRKKEKSTDEKMTRDLFRAMSLAPRQKYPRNVVEMKGSMEAFFGSDSVAISCHCNRLKIIWSKS